jgi:hypothetical protein
MEMNLMGAKELLNETLGLNTSLERINFLISISINKN